MRRTIVAMAVVLGMVLGMSACAPKEEPAKPKPGAPAPAPKTPLPAEK